MNIKPKFKRCVTNQGAAHLAEVQVPAIRRAIREHRIHYAAMIWFDDIQKILLDVDSVLRCYRLDPEDATVKAKLQTMADGAIEIKASTGYVFQILDSKGSVLHPW